MLDKTKAFFKSPVFTIVVLLAIVAYYVFKLKRLPTWDESFVQAAALIARLDALMGTRGGSESQPAPRIAPPAP